MKSGNLDLNLMHVFEAIMRHRSASRAGKELGVTASAVSHALARLRKALNDELFITGPAGMEPTPRALEMAPEIRGGMARILGAIEPRSFVPAEMVRTFNIATSDYPGATIIPPLIAALARKAPLVTTRLFPIGRMDTVRQLDDGRLDLLLGWFDIIPDRMRRMTILVEEEALVVRADHPLTRGHLTRKRLLEFPHVVVELTGTENQGANGFIDDRGVNRRNWIERLLIETDDGGTSLSGRIAVIVPGYLPVAPIIEQTDMIATLPRRLAIQAARNASLVILDIPYEAIKVPVEAVWHQRSEGDPGLQWLLKKMVEATPSSPVAVGDGRVPTG